MTPDDGLAPEAFIELVRDRVDLVEFFSGYTTLAKAGSEWRGRCPIHDEKTGSFYLNDVKGVWHCYGCGKGGNIFTFLREKEGLDFREAADLLSDRYRLPRMGRGRGRSQEVVSKQKRLKDLHTAAATFFQQFLREQRGRPFQEYLRQRDFTKEDVVRFGLGAAPDAWDALTGALKRQGYKEDELVEAGLAVRSSKGDGRIYDRFRNRLIIPICDVHGQVIAFGGRVIHAEDQPKYLNSPETPIFEKHRTLFALHLAKDAIRKQQWVAIMEGYTDVMRAHQRGIENVVAAMGTALTDEQISELKKFAQSVVLVMDADAAGLRATEKHAASLLRREVPVTILVMPPGEDPDDFLRHAEDPIAKFETAVKQAVPAIDFMLRDKVEAFRATTDPLRRGQIRHAAFAIAKLSPQSSVQEDTLRRLASMLGEQPERLLAEARQFKGSATSVSAGPSPERQSREELGKLSPTDKAVLAGMLSNPALEQLALKYLAPADFHHRTAQRLIHELWEARDRGDRSPMQHWPRLEFDPDLAELVSGLLVQQETEPPLEAFKQMLSAYRARQARQEVADIKLQIEDAGRAGDNERIRGLLAEQQRLGRELNLLERHLWPEDQRD